MYTLTKKWKNQEVAMTSLSKQTEKHQQSFKYCLTNSKIPFDNSKQQMPESVNP